MPHALNPAGFEPRIPPACNSASARATSPLIKTIKHNFAQMVAGCSRATVLSSNVLARAAADELSLEPPTPRRRWRCSPCPAAKRQRMLLGPLFLVTGAWMIASANACAKLLYLHGAVSS